MVLEARCRAWSRGALTTALATAGHSRRSRLEEWIKSRAPRTRCTDHHTRRGRIGMPRTSRRRTPNTRRAKLPKGLSGIFGAITYAILSSLLDRYGLRVYSQGYGDS